MTYLLTEEMEKAINKAAAEKNLKNEDITWKVIDLAYDTEGKAYEERKPGFEIMARMMRQMRNKLTIKLRNGIIHNEMTASYCINIILVTLVECTPSELKGLVGNYSSALLSELISKKKLSAV